MTIHSERIERVNQVYEDRRLWETIWDHTYRFYAPERSNIQRQFQPTDLYRDVYDSTPVRAADQLANTLLSGLVPPWVKWALFAPGPLVPTDKKQPLLELLDIVNNVFFIYMNQSGLTRAAQPALLDAVIGGTGCVKMNPAASGKGFTVVNVPLEYVGLEEDHEGNITSVYEKRKLKGKQILQNPAWKEMLSDKQIKRFEKGNEEVTVVSGCEKTSDTGSRQYTYFDVLLDEDLTLTEKEMKRNPYIAFRYSKISDTPYGRGPGIVNFGDARTLNKSKEFVIKSAALSMLGIWIARADGILNPYTTRLTPGEITVVNDTSTAAPSLRRIDSDVAGFSIGNQLIGDLRQSVQQGFLFDRFNNDASRTTAAEIAARAQSASQALGATYGRFLDEWLFPMVSNGLEILKEQNILPKAAKDLKVGTEIIDVIFVASLAQAQRMNDIQNIIEVATISASLAQLDPAAARIIKATSAVERIAEIRSIPRDLLNTADEAKAEMQQQQQQMLLAAQQQGGPLG